MMHCFSAGQMHWVFGIWFNHPAPTIFVILIGAYSGILWRSPIKDSLYSAMILALVLFVLYLMMTDMNNQINPHYCWGDVWRPKESKATRPPSLNNIYILNAAISGAIFLVSLALTAAIKRVYLRARSHTNRS